MRKAVILWIAACVVLFALPMAVGAEQAGLSLYVNGQRITEVAAPVVVEREVYVPVETLAAVSGAKRVAGNGLSSAAYSNGSLEWSVAAGEKVAIVAGKKVELPGAVFVDDGTMYVPIRGMDQPLGMKAVWDRLSRSLFVYKQASGAGQGSPVKASSDDAADSRTEQKPAPSRQAAQNEFVRVVSNQVIISAREGAQPKVLELPGEVPRLVLDFPSSAFGFTGSEERRTYVDELPGDGAIVKVRHALFDEATFRVVIELERLTRYTVFQSTDGLMTHVSLDAFSRPARVVIDAGHGGKDPGAEGYSGREEKHFTLELARKVYALMEADPDLTPYLTRTDDRFVELEDRAAFANELEADLFISLHGNAFKNRTSMSGVETYYYGSNSVAFANIMHEHVLAVSSFPDRGVRQAEYKVLRLADMPAVLLELGYLSNPADEKILLSSGYQDRAAEAIVQAVKQYLNLR